LKRILTLLILFITIPLVGEKIYRVLSRGSVLDKSTNLIWTRCPLSSDNKPMYDFNCKGDKKLYTWAEAKEACSNLVYDGRSDWRLPDIRELQSIIFYHHKPTNASNYSQVVEEVFPNAVTGKDIDNDYLNFFGTTVYCYYDTCYQHYWTSTTYISNSALAWAINFYTGITQWDVATKYKSVRCVAGP